MSTESATIYPTGSGCTCKTCPVHAPRLIPCPSCGMTGAHYCPGPRNNNPGITWYQAPEPIKCTNCGGTFVGAHVCGYYNPQGPNTVIC